MSRYLTIGLSGDSFQAYSAWPDTVPAPVIVVLHEIFGANHDMRALCDRLAGHGYIAICPDLFWRMQSGVDLDDRRPGEFEQAFDFYTRFDRDKGVEDIDVALDFARRLEGGTSRVALLDSAWAD